MKRPQDYSSPDSDTDEFIDVGQEDSFCTVTGSVSPGSASQILARKKRRGIIEKRRRDRINHSLSELRRLVPSAFEKQGSSKLEKAEILQMTVDHLKLLHAVGGKGYFDARALAVDYRTLGFRECVGEVVRYLSSLDGDSTDPIGARLVSHLSHCASELDPLHLQSPPASILPFPPWPWASFPQISPTSQASPSPPFPGGRRDLALLGSYPSPPTLGIAPLSGCGQALLPPAALATVHRVPPLTSSSSSSSSDPLQVSFRPFAPLGSPTAQRRGISNRAAKPVLGWGTEIGAF
eukprot:XP_011618432.1 PREDICTED: hairy/enhancer-of-split related with YRPW motif-like protein [Takifugu rubripes]